MPRFLDSTSWLALVFSALVLVAAGCPRTPTPEPEVIQLEPMYFTMLKKGEKVEVRNYDLPEVFEQAGQLFEKGRCLEAKALYLTVAESSPDRSIQGLAYYNAALCELALEKPGAALQLLDKAQSRVSDPGDKQRLGVVRLQALVETGKFDQVRQDGIALLQRPMAPHFVWSAHTSLAAAYAADRKFVRSNHHLESALDLLLTYTPIPEQYRNREIARVYFRIGQIYRELLNRLDFKLPVERMMIDMTDKLALLRHAEEIFLACVRLREPDYSSRAGIQIARLYEGFAAALLQAEVPSDLTPLELEVYQEELTAKVLPFLQRASEVYTRTIGLAQRNRFPVKWKKKAQQGKRRVEEQLGALKRSLDSAD